MHEVHILAKRGNLPEPVHSREHVSCHGSDGHKPGQPACETLNFLSASGPDPSLVDDEQHRPRRHQFFDSPAGLPVDTCLRRISPCGP
jgi:hypothetical protein